MVARDFGILDLDRPGGDVIGGYHVGVRLGREDVENILRKAAREMSRRAVSIVTVGKVFATCHIDTRLGKRPREMRG